MIEIDEDTVLEAVLISHIIVGPRHKICGRKMHLNLVDVQLCSSLFKALIRLSSNYNDPDFLAVIWGNSKRAGKFEMRAHFWIMGPTSSLPFEWKLAGGI